MRTVLDYIHAIIFTALSFVGLICGVLGTVCFAIPGLLFLIGSKRLFLNFILLAAAINLKAFMFPIGFMYAIIKSIWRGGLAGYFRTIALSIDQQGNVVEAPLFNDVMITPKGHQFGDEDRTISHVLGKNQQSDTFRFIGYVLNRFLNCLDPTIQLMPLKMRTNYDEDIVLYSKPIWI